jgi:site-specific DNA recombinase
VEDLDELVWKQVTQLLEKPHMVRTEIERRRRESLRTDPVEQRRGQLTQELKRLQRQIDKLLDAFQEGLVSLGQLRQRMPQLRVKQQTAEKELENARWKAMATERMNQLEHSLSNFTSRLRASASNLTVLEQQKVIRLLVKEIVIEADDRITVRHCLPLHDGEGAGSGPKEDCYPVCTGGDLADVGEHDPGRSGTTAAPTLPQGDVEGWQTLASKG